MEDEKPLLLGADGNPIKDEKEIEARAVIFAELCEGHPANKGLDIDNEEAPDSLKKQNLVAVKLPPNCIIATAAALANESQALMQLANKAIAVVKGRGAVRLKVDEQLHWAQAFVILFNRLNQSRIEKIQIAAEFRALFEAHGEYQAKMAAELAERESAAIDLVRGAYIDGVGDSADVYGMIGDSALEEGLAAAAERYMERFKKDPEPEATKPAEEPNAVTKAELNDTTPLAQS